MTSTHTLWLRQLQEQQAKRLDEGDLTETEQNRLQNTVSGESNSKTLMEAIGEVTGNINEEQEQLDEIPMLAPLAGMAARAVAGRVAKKAVKGVSAMVAGGREQPQDVQASRSAETFSGELQLEKAAEIVSYKLIEEFEESLGKRLTPEEIQEFVENNYDKIMAEAKNQVTAHAVPGDLHKGVGASTPEVPKDKIKMMKTKASKFNPKRSGTDY
ncbi:MAG TPA: hypothetical protein DCF87_09410 [Opitutae bacterium]|nr:hypothetical protein [Opitutae bacterium]|tara:strand:+ start:511 stop:1152 length:642 start_codon:yes stop_codon:yes gene_type:complete